MNMKRIYYNEIEPFAVEWMRELIKAGEIPDGDIGREQTARMMCQKTAIGNRRTLLAQKIRRGLAKSLIEWF